MCFANKYGSFGQPQSGFPQDDMCFANKYGSFGQPQSGFPQDDKRIPLNKEEAA